MPSLIFGPVKPPVYFCAISELAILKLMFASSRLLISKVDFDLLIIVWYNESHMIFKIGGTNQKKVE